MPCEEDHRRGNRRAGNRNLGGDHGNRKGETGGIPCSFATSVMTGSVERQYGQYRRMVINRVTSGARKVIIFRMATQRRSAVTAK